MIIIKAYGILSRFFIVNRTFDGGIEDGRIIGIGRSLQLVVYIREEDIIFCLSIIDVVMNERIHFHIVNYVIFFFRNKLDHS